jgi:hypothetical protein
LINAIKAELADRLTKAGKPPLVLTAGALVGKERATELFEAAYDEHARRLAKLYAEIGAAPKPSPIPASSAPGGVRPAMAKESEVRARPQEKAAPRSEDRRESSHERFPKPEPRRHREERPDERREAEGRSNGWSPGAPRPAAKAPANAPDRSAPRTGRDGRDARSRSR